MIKVLCVFGTRPEAIKMAPVIMKLREMKDDFYVVAVSTGQHTDMVYSVMKDFDVNIDLDLKIMKKKQSLNYITEEIIHGIDNILHCSAPDIVLVHGDTTTSMATALAAYHRGIPVGHVEAGLRSYDDRNPWPEEMNRVMVDRLSSFHFAPTERASENLRKEGLTANIYVTGNTVIDALKHTLGPDVDVTDKTLDLMNIEKKIILVTAHRRENWGTPLRNICKALKEIVHLRSDVEIIYAVHPNPNVRDAVYGILSGITGVRLISPPNYMDFANLMNVAHIVLTDSGGLQEEAPALGKPVLVMRKTTERPEAILAGTAKLVGTEVDSIRSGVYDLLTDEKKYEKMATADNPYGDGTASEKIAQALLQDFKKKGK